MSSGVPAEIAGIGSSATVVRVSPEFDPLKARVEPEEYFVLSRIDGKQTLRQILLSTGLPVERAVAIVTRLRSLGALLLPGETGAAAVPLATARPAGSGAYPAGAPAEGRLEVDLSLPQPSEEELAALAEANVLSDHERRRILAMHRLVAAHEPYALLGLEQGADAREVKRAYFRLSKQIHPDRFYGKQVGSFGARLSAVFEAASRAYAKLTSPEPARASGAHPAVADRPQTPQEYAAELYDRACALEVGGDPLEAMKLFAAAVRIDAHPRYLRRAASCALAASQPKTALEYAKKAQAQAPDDPSAARLLAAAFRAAGKLTDAEEVLVMAVALRNNNDVLQAELHSDLDEVRRLLGG